VGGKPKGAEDREGHCHHHQREQPAVAGGAGGVVVTVGHGLRVGGAWSGDQMQRRQSQVMQTGQWMMAHPNLGGGRSDGDDREQTIRREPQL
jgi:hypothetical protein